MRDFARMSWSSEVLTSWTIVNPHLSPLTGLCNEISLAIFNIPRLLLLSKMEPTKDYSLEGLTARIVESSKTINDCINQHGLPKLSFDADGPVVFPVPPTFPAVHLARLALLEATKLLSRLVTGPGDHAIFTSANVCCRNRNFCTGFLTRH